MPIVGDGPVGLPRSGSPVGMEDVAVLKRDRLRVVLTLEHIMQSIAVEVNDKAPEPLRDGALARNGIPEWRRTEWEA